LLAGTGGFNGGIECQQIGLVGNIIDDTENVSNLLGRAIASKSMEQGG
jgi:hypothetical protein